MKVRQLKAFNAVARTLNFAEASKMMFMSQPALSMAIKNLEESLGGQLIVRTTRTVSLTQEGKVLFEKSRRMLNEWESLEMEMRQYFLLERGTVSIAAIPSFATNKLPEIIAAFRQQYPNVNVQIHDVIAEETIDMVRSGKVELGVTFKPFALTEIDQFTCLSVDEYVAVVAKQHPLSSKSQINWDELLDNEFIALQWPSMVRESIERTVKDSDIKLHVSFESHQFATVGRMVGQGLGVSVVPSLCQQHMEELGCKTLPIKSPSIISELGIITRQNQPLSVPAQAFFSSLLNAYNAA